MTKIKNTKKGMAKKTLSMSLVVAMLATSNVPVWAAEFSDGSDVAVETEAPAEFTDETEAAPVVDNTEASTETVAATATEKLNIATYEVSAPTTLAGELKNNAGTAVTTFTYKWLVDGVEPANADGTAITGATGTSSTGTAGIAAFTPSSNHVGKSLTLEITGTGDFEGFTYTTPAVTIKARDIKNVVGKIEQNSTALNYDGTAKTISAANVTLTYATTASVAEKTAITAADFTFTYKGDTVNATKTGEPIKVTATINKEGYTGSLQFDMVIGKKALASSSEQNLNDKTANDLAVNMKKTQYKYTGSNIAFTADDVTLKSNISGNTLNPKAVASVTPVTTGVTLKDVGSKDKVKVNINAANDKELTRNYESSAFANAYYYAPEEVSVIARDLTTCTIDDISIGLVASKTINKAAIKNLITITEGKETLTGNGDFNNQFDIEVNVDDINKGGEGAYDVVVKPKDTTKNIVGKKTIKLHVTQNDISTTNFKSTGAQLKTGNTAGAGNDSVTENADLNASTIFADEYYQGGASITKTADQLGTIIIGSEGTVLKEGTDYKLVYKNNTNVGTAEIWIQGISSTFSGTKCIGKFNIVAPTISANTITVPTTVAYDGSKTAADEYLKKSDVKVQAAAYTWSKNAAGKFVKTKKLIDVPEKLYDTAFTPVNGVKDGSKLTTTVSLATNVDTDSNDYKNYIGTTNLTAAITLADKTTVATTSIANTTVTVVGAPFVYTGKEITPDLVVKDGDRTLVKDVDYEVVTTVNAKNAGTAKITIKGKGDYSAATTKTVEFTINKADLSKVTITPKKSAANSFKYTGSKLTPAIADYDIKLGDVTINPTDENLKIIYPASSSANVNAGKEAGSATLVVKDTAKNPNFDGTNAFKFDIAQADLANGGTFTLWKDGKVVGFDKTATTAADVSTFAPIFTNDGTEHTFDKVTYTPANKKYKEGVDYEVKYYNNTRGEVAAIYVNALGNYKNADNKKFADNKTTYTDARFFKIGSISIKKSDITVANTEYAGGISVKPTVKVKVNGNTLVEDADYEIKTVGDAANVTATDKILKAKLYAKDGYVLDNTDWGTAYHAATATEKAYVELTWKVVAKDLKNTAVSVDKDGNVTVMNGTVVVPSSEYDVKFSDDKKKVTVTAKADSKNYTGSKEVDVESAKVGQAMIANVVVKGNTVTPVLSSEVEEAVGYDYVIATEEDYKNGRVGVSKNILKTNTDFHYVQQGTYYAYCHAWKRNAEGKKVFGDWSNIVKFTVTATTPSTPTVKSVKVKGSTVTVTYTVSEDATGYDVVLGSAVKKVNGEKRPVDYGTLVKKNIKGNVVTATFKNVPAGKYYAGVHSFNKTSENGSKVFSKWSNSKAVTVK